ncbi:MAG TPA: pilus assembly protein TadG-related protein [Pantanalinema sp.]
MVTRRKQLPGKDRSHERGATLVTTAIFATGLVVVAGLVADTGAMMYERTRMQVACDAAALAGAKGLLNGRTYAVQQAKAVAAKNGYQLADAGITIHQGSRMSVAMQNPSKSVVARVVEAMQGSGDPGAAKDLSVGAKATADLHCVEQTAGPRPFGIPECDFVPGAEYVLKQGPSNQIKGNFQALGIDGTGATIYRQSILNGVRRTLRVEDMVQTEPGNMAGPTVTAINQLLGNDQTSYAAAVKGARTPRVITVPLLYWDQYLSSMGRSNVVVKGFARFYITYTTSRSEVYGRFIDRIDTNAAKGTALEYAVRLSDDSSAAPPPVNPTTL